MKKHKRHQNPGGQSAPGQAKSADTVLAFVAKGPAQDAYPVMLTSILGAVAMGLGHFSIPARGGSPYSTGYAFKGFVDEAAAIEAKLAASPHAAHFERELIQISAEEHAAAERSTSTGQLPVITVTQ